jgi:8-oxo-dGTP pyrophosphatase MutT (NUDIX family)
VDVVDEWTGAAATALQAASRFTQEEFAEKLGIGRRTVAAWHAKPDVVLSTEFQRFLDTLYELSSEPVKIRFARRLKADDATQIGDTGDDSAAQLSVAIAVVRRGSEVLLVCRRDSDTSGLSWQFPAGVVKPGASANTVAIRETLAETGVHCSVQSRLGERIHPISRAYCEYFLCDYLAGDPANLDTDENVAVTWVECAEVTKFIPAERIYAPVLKALEGTP